LQDFGDCIQSSQIGPHLVQPESARPAASTLKINTRRRNIDSQLPTGGIMGCKSGIFKPNRLFPSAEWPLQCANNHIGREQRFMHQQAAEFGIGEARRVLGEVFAPWVLDLNLSIEGFDFTPPPGEATDWQPGAILRMPFSERLCRNGGVVCGQALMAFADTSMVLANLAANRGYRPMTTVDQTTHFMRAATGDVLADARVVRLGRTMSFGHVTLLSAADNKPVAMVSSAFAMLNA
jgi:uncharacterized protein (TIGR00369 family)